MLALRFALTLFGRGGGVSQGFKLLIRSWLPGLVLRNLKFHERERERERESERAVISQQKDGHPRCLHPGALITHKRDMGLRKRHGSMQGRASKAEPMEAIIS